jgi:hypothetical protein
LFRAVPPTSGLDERDLILVVLVRAFENLPTERNRIRARYRLGRLFVKRRSDSAFIGCTIPRDLYERLRDKAAQDDRSQAAIIRLALAQYLGSEA